MKCYKLVDQWTFCIATYHVQGLTLQYYFDNGSVVVECRFTERSTADGCRVIFRESSKGTVKSINMSKSSIKESTVYQYITLPVSGNYTVTAHDIVDGTIITNPSVVYPQVLEYMLQLLLPSPTMTIFSSMHACSCIDTKYTVPLLLLGYIGTTSGHYTSYSEISSINIMLPLEPTNGISSKYI